MARFHESPTQSATESAARAPGWVPAVVLAVGTLAAHGVLALVVRPRPGVILWTDGAGYLANARWLAPGVEAPYLDVTPFYHAGWSLLLAPLYVLSDDAGTIFAGVIAVNVGLASLGAVLLWRIAVRVGGLSPWPAAAAAAVGSAYPPVLLQAGFEWAESMVFVLVAGWALALWHLLDGPATARPVVAGLVLGGATAAAWVTHPRMAALGVVTVVVLGAGAATGRVARAAAGAAAVTLAGGVAVTTVLHRAIRTATRAPEVVGTGEGLGGRLLDPTLWGEISLRVAGQTWYLVVATLGLAVVGVAVLARWGLARTGPRSWFGAAVVGAIVVAMAVSAAGPLDPRRADHHVYGRYLEMFAPLLLVVAAGTLARTRRDRLVPGALGLAALGTVVTAAIVRIGYGSEALAGNLMPLNVLGVLAWNADRSAIALGVLTAVGVLAAAALALLYGLWRWGPAVALAALVVTFAASGVVVERRHLEPFTAGFRQLVSLAGAIEHAQAAVGGPALAISYDLADRDPFVGHAYQVELPAHPFDYFDSEQGEGPAADLVIGSKSWDQRPAGAGAALVYPETHRNQALWVRPGALQDRLAALGYLAVVDLDALPAAFFDAALAPADGRAVRIENRGAGAPWVRADSVAGVPGVRLVLDWYDERHDGDSRGSPASAPLSTTHVHLDHTVLPGAAATVTIPLDPDRHDGPLPPPGSYRVRVGLAVDGVRFADRGAPEAELTIRLSDRADL